MKKLIPIITIIIVLIVAAIFLFKGCEPRTKEEDISNAIEESISEDTETEAETENAIEQYRNAFINANVTMTCLFYENEKLQEEGDSIAYNVKKIYAGNDLPVDDDNLMVQILQKYENDEDVINTIKENARPCIEGGEGVYL